MLFYATPTRRHHVNIRYVIMRVMAAYLPLHTLRAYVDVDIDGYMSPADVAGYCSELPFEINTLLFIIYADIDALSRTISDITDYFADARQVMSRHVAAIDAMLRRHLRRRRRHITMLMIRCHGAMLLFRHAAAFLLRDGAMRDCFIFIMPLELMPPSRYYAAAMIIDICVYLLLIRRAAAAASAFMSMFACRRLFTLDAAADISYMPPVDADAAIIAVDNSALLCVDAISLDDFSHDAAMIYAI